MSLVNILEIIVVAVFGSGFMGILIMVAWELRERTKGPPSWRRP